MRWIVLMYLLPGLSFAECGCACVDGLPQTVCQTIEQAQENLWLCPIDRHCPDFDSSADDLTDEPTWLPSPDDRAHLCKQVRLWDKQADAYTSANICEVLPS